MSDDTNTNTNNTPDPHPITDGMHDMVKHFNSQTTYHDFEGMVDAKVVLEKCMNPETNKYVWEELILPRYEGEEAKSYTELLRSLFLAHLYERADTYEIDDLSYDNIVDMFELLITVTGDRWWSKVTDEMIRDIEQQDEDDTEEDTENEEHITYPKAEL